MSDYARYMHAKAETDAAFQRYNYASAALELARIKERLAEIQSQHEPLGSLVGDDKARRRECVQAATFVVFGRFNP